MAYRRFDGAPEPLLSEENFGAPERRRPLRLTLISAMLLLGILLLTVLPMGPRTASEADGWNLILVNSEYHIPEDYEVELVTLRGGQQVDRRIYPDLQAMFDDMRSQGVYPIVASGYRTEEKQRQLLEEEIREQRSKGLSRWSARREALKWVSKPGTSEHQLGIAVDINQEGSLSTAKEVYDWLADNAHRYGFICRYPGDKTAITGVSSEPWHYRYVGREAAAYIWENDLCLEEYLDQLHSGRRNDDIL